MKISVVTVCFNSQTTIQSTIESFLAQTHPEKEMILVDGASTDNTLKLVRAYQSPLIRIVSEPDMGAYDAMNKGLGLFLGDAVGILNSDDTFHDAQALSRIADGLAAADIVYGDINIVTDHQSKKIVRIWHAGTYHRFGYELGWVPPHPTFYIRRSSAVSAGQFDLSYRIAADYDFMLRAMTATKPSRIRYVPRVLIDFKLGGISTRDWHATLQGNLECLRSRRQNLGAPALDLAFFLRFARRLLQLRRPPWKWLGD